MMKSLVIPGGKNWVTSVGIYLIIILALLRFLIYPLNARVRHQRVVLAGQYETHAMKSRILENMQKNQEGEKTSQDLKALNSSLYARGEAVSKIQADILKSLSVIAEGRGLTVMGFEMPEAVSGRKITEIPVVIRLKGRAESFVELLSNLKKQEKILLVKTMEASTTGQEMTMSLTVQVLRRE